MNAFCKKNSIELLEAPIHNHIAIGLVERSIQTIKRPLSVSKKHQKKNVI